MAFSVASRPAQVVAINVTPLVDVMLVLLVFFMLATPLLTRTLVLDLGAGPPPPVQLPATVRLDIAADGTVSIDGQAQPDWLVGAALQSASTAEPGLSLMVQVDDDAPYARVAAVLADARSAGILAIGVETD